MFCLVMESTFLTVWEEDGSFKKKQKQKKNLAAFTSALNEVPHLELAYLRFLSGKALFKLVLFVVVDFPEKMA